MSRIYLSAPHVGEEERRLLLEAFDSNWIAPVGPQIDAFEAEVCAKLGVASAAALSSGTAALHLALILLGVEPGDEVFCSSLTFAAPANAITYCGATPVFLDSDGSTWTIDPEIVSDELAAADARGRLPKALVAVDLYGQCADYDALRAACARYDVPIIEDAAEALGATYRGRAAGTLGDFGVLSFNGNKIVTTSGGGMLVSDRADDIAQARKLATQARDAAPHYEHSSVGYNYRLSNLLAAVGRAQLRKLEDRVRRRRAVCEFYREALRELPGVEFMPQADYGVPTCWLSCITIDAPRSGTSPETIRKALEAEDIEARPLWKPMHLQPVFESCRFRGSGVSEALFRSGLCLPSGSALSAGDLARVVRGIYGAAGRAPPEGCASISGESEIG